jgi:hypothetical protein
MRFVRPILAALLLTLGLSGCYTKFFADDDARSASRTSVERTYPSDLSEGDATVTIQEYLVPDFYPTPAWRTWGFTPFWYEPWFDPFFASPWLPIGSPWLSVGFAWSPYWALPRNWYWNGYWGWNGWGWSPPLFWGGPNVTILPVSPASAHSGAMRQFGRIRQGSPLPDAVQVPHATETVSPNRSSSEVAPNKRATQRTVSRGYYTLPRVSTGSNGSSSGLRPLTSSGSTIQQSSGTSPSRSSSGSSSSSSSSGTRTSGRNR